VYLRHTGHRYSSTDTQRELEAHPS
jgi:hypothetical protein